MKKALFAAILTMSLALAGCANADSWKPQGNTASPAAKPSGAAKPAQTTPPTNQVIPPASADSKQIGTKLGNGSAALTPSNNALIANAGVKLQPDAKVVKVHFDYQCGYCKYFELTNEPTLKKLADAGQIQLQIVFRSFLNKGHKNHVSTEAATASICAAKANKFDGVPSLVFQALGETGYPADFFTAALPKQLGLDAAEFVKCLANPENTKLVDQMEALGVSEADGTPTVFVNGVKLNLQREMLTSPEPLAQLLGGK